MPGITESELKAQIKAGEFQRVYLFFGEESYLKQVYVNRITEKAVNESFRTFNVHSLNGKETDIDQISECVEAMPMMDEYSVTVVHDMAVDKLSTEKNSKLVQLVSDLPETSILIFWQDTVCFDEKDRKLTGFVKLIDKYGASVILSKKTTGEIVKLLTSAAQKRGCSLSNDMARSLINAVGDDLNVLLNEIEKLCLFVNKREITQKDIDTVCVKTIQARIFDLSKNLITGKFDRAFDILNNLFVLKTEPTIILATIINAYVDMYRAKVSVANGGTATELKGSFNYKNKEFRLTNGLRDASKISIPTLRKALELLATADEKMKLNYEESKTRIILEELLVSLRTL